MNLYQETTIKLQSLPENLLNEVNDYVDFLLMRNKEKHENKTPSNSEHLTESGMNDYLNNLEEYEELLSQGKIKW